VDDQRAAELVVELRAVEQRRIAALVGADVAVIYERRDGRWQAVWSQATRIATR